MGVHSCEDILSCLTDDDIKYLKLIIVELIGASFLKPETEISHTIKLSPNYYKADDEEYNKKFSIARTCIISADRIVSQLEEENINLLIDSSNVSSYIDDIYNKNLYLNKKYVINKSPYQSVERFNLQKKIANNANQNTTTIVKAPAGFGKTLVGIIWALSSNKKIIWVCPRNVVSESVYDSILKELTALGFNDITVELFLTGKTEKRNHNNDKEFISDIIVTNIDNFEKPTIEDGISHRLFSIYSTNVIFDEYHEFVASEPYFAAFINVMKIRNQNTNAKTLLLSATPIDISHMWDTLGKQTTILPNKTTHYPAVHSKPYLIRVENEFNYRERGSDLIIFNSISEAQHTKNLLPNAVLYHSEFTKEEKNKKYCELMKVYGKKMIDGKIVIKSTNQQTVIATIIAQASFDVSFHLLYESCLSPEASLQRPGRCRRHDDYPEQESIITIFKPRDRTRPNMYSQSERSVVELLYDKKLMELWFQEIFQYNNKRITLDDYYNIYNNHVIKYKKERENYFNKRYRESLYNLSLIYPIKYNEKRRKNEIITAGSNKLRSLGSETFFIVAKYDNPNEYVGLFNRAIYRSYDSDFKEKGNILPRLLGSMKTIMESSNDEYDYSEILEKKKHITLDEIRRLGKKSNTPYIRYDVVYHPEYGLINTERLDEFNN
jgi:CRISPR-associated helicase Cas3